VPGVEARQRSAEGDGLVGRPPGMCAQRDAWIGTGERKRDAIEPSATVAREVREQRARDGWPARRASRSVIRAGVVVSTRSTRTTPADVRKVDPARTRGRGQRR
jgi:hypothetical protein